MRDPWGSYSEHSADIDDIPIPTTFDREPGAYPPEDSLYLWAPDLPEDFVVNLEVQS